MQNKRFMIAEKAKQVFKMAGVITVSAMLVFSTVGCDDNNSEANKNKASSQSTTEAPKKAEEKLVSKNWTIQVGGSQKQNISGMDVDYEFHLNASKKGGTDAGGLYKGTSSLKVDVDFSKVSAQYKSIIKTAGSGGGTGTDKNVRITVSKPPELAPLVPQDKGESAVDSESDKSDDKKKEAMDYSAYGKFNMSGTAKLNLSASGPQGEKAKYSNTKQASEPVTYNLKIVGDEVTVNIDNIGEFRGILSSCVDPGK